MRRRVRLFAGGVLVVLLAWPFVDTLDVAVVLRELEGADPGITAVGVLLGLVAIAAGGETNRRLLSAAGTAVSAFRFALAYGSATFARSVLPMGNAATPAIVAYAISSEADSEYEVGLATATLAELLQSVASLTLALAGVVVLLASGAGNEPGTRVVIVGALGVAVVVLGAATLGWYRRGLVAYAAVAVGAVLRGTVGRVSEKVEEQAKSERIRARLQRFYDTLDVAVADRGALASALGIALLGWFALGGALAASLAAVDAQGTAVGLVLLVPPVGALANAFPTPGGVGAAELTVTGLLAAVAGINLEAAAAVALLYRVCTYWAPALVGGACALALWASGSDVELDTDASLTLETLE